MNSFPQQQTLTHNWVNQALFEFPQLGDSRTRGIRNYPLIFVMKPARFPQSANISQTAVYASPHFFQVCFAVQFSTQCTGTVTVYFDLTV